MAEPTISQARRALEIQTPLGENVLGLRRILVQERLGRPFAIEADMSSEDPDIDFNDLVGHPVVIRLNLPSGERRFWHAFVARFQMVGMTGRYHDYRASLVPWIWVMSRGADFRIFQNQGVPDIVQDVFRQRGAKDFDARLSWKYEPWEYCVQYRETDLNFVSRLLEQEGITYYFKHDTEKGTLVLADDKTAFDPVPGYEKIAFRPSPSTEPQQEAIRSWIIEHELQPTQYAVNDYNPLDPKTGLKQLAQVTREHGVADRQIFDYPGEYETASQGENVARIRLEELQAGWQTLRAETNCMGLYAGCLFNLTDHPRKEQNREHLVTAMQLQFDAGDFDTDDVLPRFSCSFTAIPSEIPYRPPRSTPKPVVQGPQCAVVVGPSGQEIHTDEHGRVKVHFFWDRESAGDEKSSCWIRVAQGWAGKKWGSLFLPRIGHEVLVEFLEGDPDRPVITGSVYNAANTPPYDLPANKTRSTLKSSSSTGGEGFNELRFEDKKGSEEIHLHAERNLTIRVKASQIAAIGWERHETVEKKVITHFKDEHHLKVTLDEYTLHEADTHATIKGSRHEKVEGSDNLTVMGDRMTQVDGADSLGVGGDRLTRVKGHDNLKVDGNRVVESGANTSIKAGADILGKAGGSIALDGGGDVHIKAGRNVIIEAGAQISLKVGGSFIDIGPSGVSMVGPLVKANSGGSAGSGGGCSPLAPAAPAAPDEPDPKDPAKPPGGKPGQVTSFSSAAQVLKYAALTGLPFCEECPREQPVPPPKPDDTDDQRTRDVAATAEIEINNTPGATDDLVRLKGGNPVVRFRVPCRVRLTSDSPADVTVVITNPDGRLRFPDDAATTVTLTLPTNGDWVEFEISGETASAAIGDAKIEVHQDTAAGAVIGRKDVTVFSFDPAALGIANPGTYRLVGGRYRATGGVAASYSAEGNIKPAGVDCAAPQLADLRIGIMQNVISTGDVMTVIWDTPTIEWDPGVAAGTVADVPSSITRINRLPAICNDVAPGVAPLYDQPGKPPDTLDENSLKAPTGCPDGGPATSSDTPSTTAPEEFVQRAADAAGAEVGTVTYTLKSARINAAFKTWTVVFNPTDDSFETIRERGWRLDVISSAAATQKATTDAADAAPSTVPVLTPTANEAVNDPANRVFEQGAATRFTR